MSAMYSMSHSIQSVPPVVWSGVVGAVVALLGVILNSWLTARNQANEKRLDRTMALRKEVYLPLVASLAEVQLLLGGLASGVEIDLEPLVSFTGAASKVSIIAETKTTILANRLSSELNLAFMDLNIASFKARGATMDIGIHKELRLKAQAEVDIATSEINKFHRAGSVDRLVFDALQRNRDSHVAEVRRCSDLEVAASFTHTSESMEYLRRYREKIPALSNELVGLYVAIRAELGLETGPEYIESLDLQRDRTLAGLDAHIQHLEVLVEETRNS